jgi:xanthine dehydrogenase accessory factor
MSTRALRERAEDLRASRQPFVYARVVLAERPTSAKPGDEAIVLADGTIEGFVGGQCAQATLRAQGLQILQEGNAALLRIAPTPEPDQQGKVVVHNPCLSGGTLEIFMEPVLPAPMVRVVGQAPIARAIAGVGASLGWEVQGWTEEGIDAVDAVVIASHGVEEEAALVAAVESGVPYVGLIASPRRGRAVVDSLPLTAEQKSRIRTPAGLDIGARTPEEVALSVLAQVIEERRRSTPIAHPPAVEVVARGTAIDPVCKMTVAAIDTSPHADVDGTRWFFCCEGCKVSFLADPAAHAG